MTSDAAIWLFLQEYIVAQHPADAKKMATETTFQTENLLQTEPTFAFKQ